MNAELRACVLAAAASEPSPTRAAVKRRNALVAILAAAGGLAAFVMFARLTSDGELVRLGGAVMSHRHAERSVGLVATTAGGALAVAATALWFALRGGRSMLGRSRRQLLGGIVLIPLALLTLKVGCSLAFGDPMAEWLDRAGLRCLSLSLVVAAGPLAAFLAARRRSAPVHAALNGAAIGVACGACAWVALDLWCPVAFLPHLLVGHVVPLCMLAGMGALLGQALLSLRSR